MTPQGPVMSLDASNYISDYNNNDDDDDVLEVLDGIEQTGGNLNDHNEHNVSEGNNNINNNNNNDNIENKSALNDDDANYLVEEMIKQNEIDQNKSIVKQINDKIADDDNALFGNQVTMGMIDEDIARDDIIAEMERDMMAEMTLDPNKNNNTN